MKKKLTKWNINKSMTTQSKTVIALLVLIVIILLGSIMSGNQTKENKYQACLELCEKNNPGMNYMIERCGLQCNEKYGK